MSRLSEKIKRMAERSMRISWIEMIKKSVKDTASLKKQKRSQS